MSELNLILLGPPGAGKGTQAARLSDDFGLPYIGTGDLLRGHRADGTELGRQAEEYMAKGQISCPDELVIGVILDKSRRRATTASCSTASRARAARPTRSARRWTSSAAG